MPMLERLGWIGTAISAGLLLQIAVQINGLHWLPDFPVYLGLALLAGGTAVGASLLLFAAAASKSARSGSSPAPFWVRMLVIGGFASLAIVHAVLAVGSSSTAVEWWRNAMLWPAALAGISVCVLTGPRWKSLLVLWPLGEAAAALLGCWYAPNSGESHSLRAYQYVLAAALISAAVLLPAILFDARCRRSWSLWGFAAASLAMPLVCLLQPDTAHAQGFLSAVALLRLGMVLIAVDRSLASDRDAPGQPT